MTHYAPDLDERSEFPSEDESAETLPRRARSWLVLAAVAGALVASAILLS